MALLNRCFSPCFVCINVLSLSFTTQPVDETKSLDDVQMLQGVNIEQSPYARCKLIGNPKHCGPNGYTLDCSNIGLNHVPKTFPSQGNVCALDLSHNSITVLPSLSFVNMVNLLWLNISSNRLTHVESGAFEGLSKLGHLRLNSNELSWPEGFGKGAFAPLKSLLHLNLKRNNITTFADMDEEFQEMKNLTGFFINGCINCTFGRGFVNLTELQNVSLSGQTRSHPEDNNGTCRMGNISKETFEGIPQIHNLWIMACDIRDIDTEAFAPIKDNIELLDMSYNANLKFSGMRKGLQGLRGAPKLKILNVNKIHDLYEMGTMLKYEDVETLKTFQNLETLHMDLNKIEVFDPQLLNLSIFPASLRNLTLSGNRLTYGKYIQFLSNVTNVTFLDISRQHLNLDPFEHEHYTPDTKEKVMHEDVRMKRYPHIDEYYYDYQEKSSPILMSTH